jgi:hypothetical protein
MKVIGDRISILKKDNLLSIVILPTNDKKKLGLLFLWLMAWSVCGIIVFVNYFRLTDENAKLFIIVYLSFWAYFEYNITRAFIWKKFGKEKLWIQDGVMYYQKEVNKKGKISQFNLELVDKVKMLELSNTSLADTVNQSFWVRGGERLEFQSQAKVQRFGLQINDEEARIILNEINSYIS